MIGLSYVILSPASALKRRRNKKSGQAAMPVTPWKYEDQMNFYHHLWNLETRRQI